MLSYVQHQIFNKCCYIETQKAASDEQLWQVDDKRKTFQINLKTGM